MALLYPWATKEYLLWQMSLSQIYLYHREGMKLKYPQDKSGKPRKAKDKSAKELRGERDQLRKMYGDIGEG